MFDGSFVKSLKQKHTKENILNHKKGGILN